MTEQRTQNTEQSDRVKRKLNTGHAAMTTKTVHVRVRVPRLALPPADDRVRHKVRVHLVCLALGGMLATITTFVFGVWFAVHISPFIPTGPGLVMEYLDRVRNR